MKNKVSSWKVGDVKITRIIEGERAGPMFVVPDAIPENIIKMPWLQPYFSEAVACSSILKSFKSCSAAVAR